ncbi:MAG: ribosome small subunit-dependent GTPase A [Desulfobacteraceae bacterium]|nr:ribosome small subunit-dependent GTPase A [Desulfobacteraceae bacterium]
MLLKKYGFEKLCAKGFDEKDIDNLARITAQYNKIYTIVSNSGEKNASVSGRFIHEVSKISNFPVVGDWVKLREGTNNTVIESVIPRTNQISRSAAGKKGSKEEISDEQVIAANIDNVFIISGLDRDFNLRRIERYLTLAYNSSSKPIIILNKADLCDDIESRIAKINSIAFGVDVQVISAIDPISAGGIYSLLKKGETSVLLGSSGAGKSTLINALSGSELQNVKEISNVVNKGKHTTTNRELFLLSNGSILIDNPGMRELGLYDSGDSIKDVFSEIEELSLNCKFNNCNHEKEPGCAVIEAIENGSLLQSRYKSYIKLKKEAYYLKIKNQKTSDSFEKEKWKSIRIEQRLKYKISNKK